MDLRTRTYEILGLELGSLTNEGGRDWNEAEAEAKKEMKTLAFDGDAKKDHNFNREQIIYSEKYIDFHKKAKVAKDLSLSKAEVKQLILCNDKDVILDVLRYQKVEDDDIKELIVNGTYLVRKYIEDNLS